MSFFVAVGKSNKTKTHITLYSFRRKDVMTILDKLFF